MAQDKKKSTIQIAGENEAMAADNVTVDPSYVAAVEAQKAQMDSTLQAERVTALEAAENAEVPVPPTIFELYKEESMKDREKRFQQQLLQGEMELDIRAKQDSLAKRAAEVEVGKNFSIWDITTDLGLQFNPFKKEEKQ
jgi:hypothetical protein